MWKAVGVSLLRCGAIYSVFGVFGVAFYIVKWSRPARQSVDSQADDLDAL